MVAIRLRKTGSTNAPSFRVVAADSRSPRDGRFIEILGYYDPKRKGENYVLKQDRIDYWRGQGAVVSDSVANILRRAARAAKAGA
ncbi:MAG: 30S ribosomal protein S16 [Kiritimatiellae bacterium]|nr:30S ribosomal protein S16 [Kiritimatiellia bacterium]